MDTHANPTSGSGTQAQRSTPQQIQQETEEALVPYSGNIVSGIYKRGKGPPYAVPPAPHPKGNQDWKIEFHNKSGKYYWWHNKNRKYTFNCPPEILPTITTDEDYEEELELQKACTETPPLSDEEDKPQESDEETAQEEEQEYRSPIPTEQENPLTLATTPRHTTVPPLQHTPIAETPILGITHLTQRQATPESSDEEPPLLLPPVVGVQVLPTPLIHHILNIRTGLMAAQPAPQQPAAQTLTVDQLQTQLAKVQDSKILFSRREDPRAFKN